MLLGCAGVAVLLSRDLHHERERADALAQRLIELEPLERGGDPIPKDADVEHRTDEHVSVQQVIESPPTAMERPRHVKEYQGTLRTRQQVERLQSALERGTLLQDYQIQPLITALDKVRYEIEQEDSNTKHGARVESGAETNRRIVRAAADILFESQLDTFVQLLDDEFDAKKKE